jgi:hypothetical protein
VAERSVRLPEDALTTDCVEALLLACSRRAPTGIRKAGLIAGCLISVAAGWFSLGIRSFLDFSSHERPGILAGS